VNLFIFLAILGNFKFSIIIGLIKKSKADNLCQSDSISIDQSGCMNAKTNKSIVF